MDKELKALIQQWVEELHGEELCVRLMIDATVDGVVIPDWVAERWADALPIDLDPSYPLDLRYEDAGLHCCLSFGGPWDCFFPWPSIYVVQARDAQVGVLIDEHLPTRLRRELEATGELEPEVEQSPEGDQAAESEAEPEAEPAEGAAGESVEGKRARFRVIEGGKR